MSYYSTWHLGEPPLITDPAGFMAFLGDKRSDGYDALVNLVRWQVEEVLESEDIMHKTIKKVYTFYGFYPNDSEFGNGTYGINHFSPGDVENIQFISDMARFMEPFEFIVFGENWPGLGSQGDCYLVTASPSAGAAAIPHELVEVR